MKNTKTFNAFLEESEIKKYSKNDSAIDEKNADGTISPDEAEEIEDLIIDLNFMLDEIINMVKTKTEEIGGDFRSPGYTAQCVKVIKEKLRKAKML